MLADFAEPTNDFVDTLRTATRDPSVSGIESAAISQTNAVVRNSFLTEGRLENSREYEKNESTEAAPDTYRHFEQLTLLPV